MLCIPLCQSCSFLYFQCSRWQAHTAEWQPLQAENLLQNCIWKTKCVKLGCMGIIFLYCKLWSSRTLIKRKLCQGYFHWVQILGFFSCYLNELVNWKCLKDIFTSIDYQYILSSIYYIYIYYYICVNHERKISLSFYRKALMLIVTSNCTSLYEIWRLGKFIL